MRYRTGPVSIRFGACRRSIVHPRDDARSPLKRDVSPEPAERDDEAVLKANKQIDVGEQPGWKAFQLEVNGRVAADYGEVPSRPETERFRRLMMQNPGKKRPTQIPPLLVSDLGKPRKRLPILGAECGFNEPR